MQGQTYDKLWTQVEQAQKKGLPKSTINLTEQIFKKAQAEKNSPQMLKAYTARSMYQQQITPDSFYVDLKGLEQWVKTSQNQVECAVLHTLIASLYADYAANNQWQLRQTSNLTGEVPEDIREWSASLFVKKVLDHTYAALEDSTLLLATSSKEYRPFVKLGSASEYYRHDMYHLLALKGVNSLQQLSWMDTSKQASNAVLTVFDRLIRTYSELNNKDALILVSLDRLRWEYMQKNEDFLPALDKMIADNNNREVAAEIYLEKANQLIGKNEYVKALQVTDEAINKYPRYNRINAVKETRETILSPDFNFNMDAAIYPEAEYKITVSHRNLAGFTIEYYQVNLPVTSPLIDRYDNFNDIAKYTKKINSQHIDLTKPTDYLLKDTVYTLTAPKEGLYLVRVLPDAATKQRNDQLLSVTRFSVLSTKLPDNRFEVAVLDATTGQPVQNAQVHLFTNDKGEKVENKVLTTNAEGRAITEWGNKGFQFLTVEKGTDKAMKLQYVRGGYYYAAQRTEEAPGSDEVKLLTDRSLYRPGQIVYVKGIAYNMLLDTANVTANKKFTLRLQDSNRREINSQKVVTNEFGSFTAQIVLPAGGLNGTYYLSTESSTVNIRVEEYKRPTFDITFDKQDATYRIGDNIEVKGTVKTYSGVSVQDVPVNYTIKRFMRGWWGRYMGNETLIASGAVTVDDNGNFSIPVSLLADEQQRNNEGFYVYNVEATVTNIAGETQSSQTSIAAGSRSLLLGINAPADKLNKDNDIKITFTATNLSAQPINVKGTYKLYPFSNYKERKAANEPVLTGSFTSNTESVMTNFNALPSGAYKLVISANDAAGREATADREIILFSPADTRPAAESDIWYYAQNVEFDKNTPASFVFGTSHKDAYILVDVFSATERVESKILHLSDSLVQFTYPYQQKYKEGLLVSFIFVKDNKTFTHRVRLEKKLPAKELKLKWEVFRDKLRPGQKEEWRLTIMNPQGVPADAEMLATLYDASLDKIWKTEQNLLLDYGRRILPHTSWMTYNGNRNYYNFWFSGKSWTYPALTYDDFWTTGIAIEQMMYDMAPGVSTRSMSKQRVEMKYSPVMETDATFAEDTGNAISTNMIGAGNMDTLAPTEDLRTNFAETAFFYPQLRTNEKGEIVISFTIPESLTRWNFHGYAHTKDMLTGMLKGEVTTSKEFMLTPNLPRFVRVGDKTSVAASVTNTTGNVVSGTVTFTLFDPLTDKVIAVQKEKFTAAASKSAGVNFTFAATDKYEMLGCRIVADGGQFSDGEQHLLPVLSNKERITETVSIPVRGNETREFSLESLFNNNSKTATDRKLTVEYSGNPAWYAIQALPTISLPTNDDAISWTTAYYANSVAYHIIKEQSRIKTIFDYWKEQGGTKETFISNLQKNQDVKNILLEESPWLMEATSEADQISRIATLFDLNTISNNNITALTKLKDLQLNDGSWSWYKGMSGSRYITTYVLENLSRLNLLTGSQADEDVTKMQQSAFNYLHKEALDEYNRTREMEKKGSKVPGISSNALQYLYLIAISGQKVPSTNQTAYDYFLNKVRESLLSQSVKGKAMSAVILKKAGRNSQAYEFMASLKEYLVKTDELGMYFDFNESPYRWNNLRIPTHVAVMEAFDIVYNDARTIEEMKIWLLKQKQTQQWDSPLSTANAIHALLYRGTNLLDNRGDVRITIGNKTLETLAPANETIQGISYVKQTYTDKNQVSKPSKIKVEKRDDGIAWGAVYAQYSEDIDKVNRNAGELGVDKKLYVEKVQGTTKELVPVTAGTPLAVGDKVVSRITITLDRAMDFIQLKDQRGACFEPIGALSGYSRSNGIGYYVAVKDASTNFFFDSLGKGVYVLEYSYRVSRTGVYEGGLAIIQSAYAPEFASHSASVKVEVK